ncbi:hypothetical protein AB4Y77_11040 [Paenarthrobacter sp. YAF11_1]|uniref:hypothetical protein n=1 Tax=Paenarthrobacter sp. YAF11_1 TaxID=3233074 RepID=UPI003F9432CE
MKIREMILGTCIAVSSVVCFGLPPAYAATAPDYTGVGSSSIAVPTSGARAIYVDDQGSDVWGMKVSWGYKEYNRISCLDSGKLPVNDPTCPEPSIDRPLRTVQGAVKVAKPGDVIIVRAGTYDEKVGWSARPGRSDAPIRLQSYPNETVSLNGYLKLSGGDYWTVQGIKFGYSATNTTGQAIVSFFGGTGWSFINNEIAGTHGVANLHVRDQTPTSTTIESKTAAAPHKYLIGANCIRQAAKSGTPGEMHNIYLMPTIYSSDGTIENNLIGDSPLGAGIKASGSQDPTGAPRGVIIKNNTILYGASGIVIGQQAEGVETIGNLIAKGTGSGPYDGGVKTYDLVAANKNSVKDSLIQGYKYPIRQPWQAATTLYERRNVTPADVSLTGSLDNCSIKASNTTIRATYGHFSTK